MESKQIRITIKRRIVLDQAASYRVEIQGRSEDSWSDYLSCLTVDVARLADGTPVTILTGIADQSSLHGLLSRIRDLGLPLLLVEYLEENS